MAIRMLAVLYNLGAALFTDPAATACLFGLWIAALIAIVAAAIAWHHLRSATARRKATQQFNRRQARTGALRHFQNCAEIFRAQTSPNRLRAHLSRRSRRS